MRIPVRAGVTVAEEGTNWSTATADEILADLRDAKRRMYEDTRPRYMVGCPQCFRPIYSGDAVCWNCGKAVPQPYLSGA
jgi:hypothetical protein